jgi:ferrous iron transport protein A
VIQAVDTDDLQPLGRGAPGMRGVVARVGHGADDPAAIELERRLLEIGFVEGAQVEILHIGPIGGDPLAVRVDDARVAVRRREALLIMIRVDRGAR